MSRTSKAIDDDPLIGKTLGGKYTIRRTIGHGGVGVVYLAEQVDDGRDAVVKVLAPQWASDDEALARFDREAQRLEGLRHPNIVTMYDFGRHKRTAYLAMEYLQGELLSAYVDRNGSLTLEQFVPIAAQILKGIGHAHSREMMIRDIKPANVMLCERKGRANFVKILDFGLAKLIKGDSPITEEHVMGTVGYLSPEQIKGEDLDLRVDVYALGVMFYYMLSGKRPFDGENNAAIFYKTVHDPAPDLRTMLPAGRELPDGLVALVHRCLEKDRTLRPADADEIVEGLIDVVPAALFRLPRAASASATIPTKAPPGFGNSGMLELLRAERGPGAATDAPARPRAATPSPAELEAVTTPLPPAETAPAALPETTAEVDPAMLVAEPAARRFPSMLVVVAFVAVIGGVLAASVLGGDDDPAVADAPAEVATPDAAALARAFDEIDRLVAQGDLDVAVDRLDEIRGDAQRLPQLAPRVARTDGRIESARLMATATTLEREGNVTAAIAAYRGVLAHDASHAGARAAIARLTDASAGDDAPATAPVEIASEPAASLTIDAKPAGTTPYHGALPVGTHAVRLSARGYHTWEGTIDVLADGTEPLRITLARKKGREPSAQGPPTTPRDPEPHATPKPEPEPATPTQTQTQTQTDNPFLPTKKSDKSKVFLPTKKNE